MYYRYLESEKLMRNLCCGVIYTMSNQHSAYKGILIINYSSSLARVVNYNPVACIMKILQLQMKLLEPSEVTLQVVALLTIVILTTLEVSFTLLENICSISGLMFLMHNFCLLQLYILT